MGQIKKLYHDNGDVVITVGTEQTAVYPITASSAVYHQASWGTGGFSQPVSNILASLDQGYLYLGMATPTTNPGVYNHKVFYLASEEGTYSYFGDITVTGLTVLKNSGNGWVKEEFNITGGGGGGPVSTGGYIGTTPVRDSANAQDLTGISNLYLEDGAKIYFGGTGNVYLEYTQNGFHFSQSLYSDGQVAAGGIGSGSGGGGGGGSSVSIRDLLTTGTTIGILTIDGVDYTLKAPSGGGGSGSVTSVGLTVPTGLTVSNSPITSSGNIAVSYASGYSIPTTAKQNAWDAAAANLSNYLPLSGGKITGSLQIGATIWGTTGTTANWSIDNDGSAVFDNISANSADFSTIVLNGNPLDWFTVETVDGSPTLKLNTRYAGLWTASGWISVGGVGSGSGGSGGASSLWQLSDVDVSSRQAGDMLTYSNNKWVNISRANLLTDYAKKSWVQSTLGSYVTFTGTETISGAKTFTAATTSFTGNISVGSVISVANSGVIDLSNSGVSMFNYGHRGTRAFNAYGSSFNLRACNSDGTTANIIALTTSNIQVGSTLIPNYTAGYNLGGSPSNQRWATIYGENGNLTGDLTLANTSHIDIGPLRIEYDSTNKALHITKVSSSDNNNYGIYADGFIASGGIQQTS